MQVSELTIRLLLLFFPGVLCAFLFDELRVVEQRKASFFLLRAFVLGVLTYLIVALAVHWLPSSAVSAIFGRTNYELRFFATTPASSSIAWQEVFAASVVAVGLAGFLSAGYHHKWLHRLARLLNVSYRSGYDDVWGVLFNSPDVDWVVVRDHSRDLAYHGWVNSWAHDGTRPELFLRDVEVLDNETGEVRYRVGGLYLSRASEDMTLEVTNLEYSNNDSGSDDDG